MGTHSSSCKIISITGPTASGKTTFANLLKKEINNNAVIICQDNYYKDWSYLSKQERKKINFDDIKAFDFRVLEKDLELLKKGKSILMSQYDFVQSKRLKITQEIKPKPFIIVEGLMPFFAKKLRDLFDYKIYIDTKNSVCLARRIKRDIKQRGETMESVYQRYFNDVLPMQKKYVEPQKKLADIVVDGSKKFDNNLLSNILKHISK